MKNQENNAAKRSYLIPLVIIVLAAAALCFSLTRQKASEGEGVAAVILHTNDVHAGYEDDIGYDGLALYKKELEKKYENVFLVDCGDAIQGAPIGAISKGIDVIRFMNYVGYDLATLGNHEFDFGVDALADCAETFEGSYICANFCTSDGTPIYAPCEILDAGDVKIGFIGVVTPDAFSKTVLHDILNESGEPMYSFLIDDSGEKLCTALQGYIDELRAQGADYVFLLSHLGNAGSITPYFKTEAVVRNLTGLTMVLDGHSHETCNTTMQDKEGREVPVAQTGTKLAAIGQVTIYKDGTIEETLISEVPEPGEDGPDYETVQRGKTDRYVDPDTKAFMDDAAAVYDDLMDQKVGELAFDMRVRDESGEISRRRENELGDLVTDALRAVGKAQIGFTNAGAVRNNLPAGELTYRSILNILPYSNEIVTIGISGQTLLDALEHAVSQLPQASGRFPQVSGLSFTVDLSKGSTVKYDQEGQFVAVMGDYRVSDVLVGGEPLDLNAEYTMAVSAFIADGADGYGMLKETDLLSSTMLPDNEVVMKYIKENLGGVIPDDYRQTQGRITIKDTESSSGSTADTAQSAEPKTTGRDTPVATGSEQPADTEYIPGRYTAKDPAALGGNSASEFYVELNKDHTGVISLLDQIPIAWYSEEGVILNADTGEQLYEFRVEEDLLTLIDSAENGGASFEFERE